MTKKMKRKIFVIMLLIFGILAFKISLKEKKTVTTIATGTYTPRNELTDSDIQNRLDSIKELVSCECGYTGVGRFEKSKTVFGKKINFTESSFTIGYKGMLKAGVDLSKAQVKIAEDIIYIKIPEADFTSNELYLNSIQIYDERQSVINNINITDITSLLEGKKQGAQDKAVRQGFLNIADKNAKRIIEDSLTCLIKLGNYKDYRIVVGLEGEN